LDKEFILLRGRRSKPHFRSCSLLSVLLSAVSRTGFV